MGSGAHCVRESHALGPVRVNCRGRLHGSTAGLGFLFCQRRCPEGIGVA